MKTSRVLRWLMVGLAWGWMVATVLPLGAAGIREGMSRAEVEAELGLPLSSMAVGDRLILNYPDNGRVELEGGRVTRVVRVRHQDDPATPEDLAAQAAAQAEAAARAAEEAEAAEEAKWEKESAAAEAEWAKAQDESRGQIESAVERLSGDQERLAQGGAVEDFGLASPAAHFWPELLVAVLIQVAVGMVILKLAFAWTDVHADWGQMFLPALAAAGSGALVRAGAFAFLGTQQLFHLDDAISYGVLLFTLMKTTHACTLARAAGVAMATKLMAIVVWTFLGVALSRILFA